MKIALAQIRSEIGAVEANCEKFYQLAQVAKTTGCEVIIFPEMSDTGYFPASFEQYAGCWPGPAYKAASNSAKDNKINLICGLSERVGQEVYNSLACFDSSGQLIGSYRKTHLFSVEPLYEDRFCKAGDQLVVVKINGAKWGLSICYDLRFPELYRNLTLNGAEILLNCAAWPAVRGDHWSKLIGARAIENQIFFVGVDRVGKDNELEMNGCSTVVAPTGEVLAIASSEQEEVLIADLDLTLVNDFRSKIPAIKSRRSDLY